MSVKMPQASTARHRAALPQEAKNTKQIANANRYTPSWKRPLSSGHQLRIHHAVMPEIAAFFYFL
jgi:hypothetical protein